MILELCTLHFQETQELEQVLSCGMRLPLLVFDLRRTNDRVFHSF